MATNFQASQYLGSKISLITKAELRYEGILYALDLNEATISLAKVKAYGSEDRPTDKPVPPNEELFEFIIFRGTDIKTLDVVEPPKSVSALNSGGPPNDPAIVEVSYYHSGGNNSHSAGTANKASHKHNANVLNHLLGGQSPRKSGRRTRSRSAGSNNRQANGQQRRGNNGGGRRRRTNRSGNNNSGGSNNGNQSDTSQNAAAASSNNGNGSGQLRQSGRGRTRGRPNRQNSADATSFFAQMQQAAAAAAAAAAGAPPPHAAAAYFQPPPPYRGAYRGWMGPTAPFPPSGYRNNPNLRRNHPLSRPGQLAAQPVKVKFEEEFNFEKSNEELEQRLAKLEIADKEKAEAAAMNGEDGGGENDAEKENKEAGAPSEPIVYYDKDNFFDSISCEALKKPQQQGQDGIPVDRRVAEQKLNLETFGRVGPRGGRGGIGGQRRGPPGGGGGFSFYPRNNYYNRNPYLSMMTGGYDPMYFMPGNGGFGNGYRRGGGGGSGGGAAAGGRNSSGGRTFYRGGFYDTF